MKKVQDILRPVPLVHGRDLNSELRTLTTAQRAVYAASYDRSAISFIGPTNDQWAAIFRICTPYLVAARRLTPAQRELVLLNMRPLIEPEDRIKTAVRKIGTEAAFEALCNV